MPNAVGVVRVGDLQLTVKPKIPIHHLLYLFERSGALPRLGEGEAELAEGESLWPLVASWFIASLERLIRAGLASGYTSERGALPAARGRILTLPTANAFQRGRMLLVCDYEEFNIDTPLNRVVAAAARAVAASVLLPWEVRRRASRTLQHLEGIGPLCGDDIAKARAERHTYRYELPLKLARQVLASTGRTLDAGDEPGQAFLLRTPELVEAGLRTIIAKAFSGLATVEKRTLFLADSHHSLTPDLVFEDEAIGDVKYKLWIGDWDRADLYQLVAFATGFGVRRALRVGFSSAPHDSFPVRVGSVQLSAIDWWCDGGLDPSEAEQDLVARLRAWWMQA